MAEQQKPDVHWADIKPHQLPHLDFKNLMEVLHHPGITFHVKDIIDWIDKTCEEGRRHTKSPDTNQFRSTKYPYLYLSSDTNRLKRELLFFDPELITRFPNGDFNPAFGEGVRIFGDNIFFWTKHPNDFYPNLRPLQNNRLISVNEHDRFIAQLVINTARIIV